MTRILARDPARRCLRPAEWPEADRALWEAALAPGDPLEPGGARAGYRPASNRRVESDYGRWLASLRHRGLLDAAAPPASRIARGAVRAYLAELERFNGTATRVARLEGLHQAARVMDPGADWSWLRRLAARVRSVHVPARDKRRRLVHAAELFAQGLRAMDEAAGTPRQRALRYRDGLVVALLAARPLRRRNLAGLRLGRSIARRGDGGWWIAIPAAETKTGEPIEMPWPDALAPALEAWLEVHRPVLASLTGRWHRPAGDALWLSADGSPMTQMALYDRVVAATRAAFGRGVNPHLFRDCAATSIAVEDPGHVRVAARVLGHRGLASTERHYNQARALEAARLFQSGLEALRGGGRRGGAPAPGGTVG